MRHTWKRQELYAECQDCDWCLCAKNALGVAAQHHDRTGHSVRIEITGIISYLSEKDHQARLAERANLGLQMRNNLRKDTESPSIGCASISLSTYKMTGLYVRELERSERLMRMLKALAHHEATRGHPLYRQALNWIRDHALTKGSVHTMEIETKVRSERSDLMAILQWLDHIAEDGSNKGACFEKAAERLDVKLNTAFRMGREYQRKHGS